MVGMRPHSFQDYETLFRQPMQSGQAIETSWIGVKWDLSGFSDLANFLIWLEENTSCYSDLDPTTLARYGQFSLTKVVPPSPSRFPPYLPMYDVCVCV